MQISKIPHPAALQNATGKAADAPAPASTPPAAKVQERSREDLATLQQAQEAVRMAAPDFDVARVAEIKAALARGDVRFDADKLAGTILSLHGKR